MSNKISLKKCVSLFLATMALVVYLPTFAQGQDEAKKGFLDVARTHEYYVPITYLASQEVIKGYDDGNFKSDKFVNKAEALKIIIEGSDIPTDVVFSPLFPDVTQADWFWSYVMKAHGLGIVNGNDEDGTFTGYEVVNLAEFLKMLLLANEIDVTIFEGKQIVPNVDPAVWFSNYASYAAQTGIISLNENGEIDPSATLTRGEVVNLMYLLIIVMNGSDTDFLTEQMEQQVGQIEIYIADNRLDLAKTASKLADDIGQQIIKNDGEDLTVVAAAKVARAYDLLVDAYIAGTEGNNEKATDLANQVIQKANEAQETDGAQESIAIHLKEIAQDILEEVEADTTQ